MSECSTSELRPAPGHYNCYDRFHNTYDQHLSEKESLLWIRVGGGGDEGRKWRVRVKGGTLTVIGVFGVCGVSIMINLHNYINK